MMFVIWLDDIRPIASKYISEKYTVSKSVNDAIYRIKMAEENGYKDFVLDLDHDLGDYASDGGDGIKLIDWLIETGRNTPSYKIKLHTMNPVGRERMMTTIKRYWE